jgi:hypothetical protein
VPEIGRFFGIVILMFMEAGAAHDTPHFHAYSLSLLSCRDAGLQHLEGVRHQVNLIPSRKRLDKEKPLSVRRNVEFPPIIIAPPGGE